MTDTFLQVTGFDPLQITAPNGAPGPAGTNGVGVASATIDGSGHLILTMTDGSTIDAGLVTGGGGGAVASVNAKTGVVVLTADDIGDGTTNKAYTAAEKTKLAAISGTNTGDETLASIKSKLGITTLSGSNTGDQDLSALAPKASPAFTGTPTAPTPTVGDNSTKIATTAFVTGAIGTSTGLPATVRTLTGNTTLAAGDSARFNCTSGPLTATLPASPTAGQAVLIKKIDSNPANPVTIQGGTIEGNTSLQLNAPMSAVLLVFTTQWEIAGSVGNVSGGTAIPLPPVTGATAIGNGQVSVYFADNGPPATSYTVTASPGGASATGASSPITVSGLTNGTAYTFTVAANNATGSASSGATPSATPVNFTPSSISGLSAWYDPAHLTGVADGATIATLPDLSGAGNSATQATASRRPIFWSKSGTITLPNNQPVLQFSGAQSLATLLTAPNLAQPTTIFLVASCTTSGVVEFIFDGGNSRQTVHFDSDHFLDLFGGSGVVHSTVPMPMAFSSICAQYNGASSFLRKGGTQIAAGNPGSANLTGITLGASSGGTTQFHTGLIGEVLVYQGALTLTQIQSVEAYLLGKWGV